MSHLLLAGDTGASRPVVLKAYAGPQAVKDVDEQKGIVTGYWSSWGTDDAGDEQLPGCWAKSIRECGPGSRQPRIQHLHAHKPVLQLGYPHVLKEDSYGLYFENKIIPTSWGRDVLTLYQYGGIKEHSVGFTPVQAKSASTGGRQYVENMLFEGSSVTWGQNRHTPTLAVKGAGGEDFLTSLLGEMAVLEKVLREGRWQTEEIPRVLDLQLKCWRAEVAEYQAALAAPAPPPEREHITVTAGLPHGSSTSTSATDTGEGEPMATQLKDLLGGDTAKAATTVTGELARRQRESALREERWRIEGALDTVVYGIRDDQALSDEQKLAKMALAYQEFAQLMQAWWGRWLALVAEAKTPAPATGDPEDDASITAAGNGPQITKAGADPADATDGGESALDAGVRRITKVAIALLQAGLGEADTAPGPGDVPTSEQKTAAGPGDAPTSADDVLHGLKALCL